MTEKTQSFFEKNAVIIKISAIAFLSLMLLIPTAMIQSLVSERQQRLNEATHEISSKWGTEQQITGPILTIPYYSHDYDTEKKAEVLTRHLAYFLPENLDVTGDMSPEVRYRGIFQVAVYNTNLNFSGKFKKPTFDASKKLDVMWEDAYITVGISDLRGIKENIKFGWNGKEVECDPGVKSNSLVESGITVNNALSALDEEPEYKFNFNISLNGSRSLNLVPVGKETKARITSSWQNPSFDGAFLPETREISEEGFDAQWHVLELNRNFPQHWDDYKVRLSEAAFGVSLLLPVDTYQITERSMKYAILFISLTFMVFFFIEIMRKLRVHPVQYILVGFGLVLFYLLLLSLAEQMHFAVAYLIASIGIITMITSYSLSIFKNKKLAAMMAGILILLYVFLYILLQMQDYALLMGSIGLFIILSTIMYLSRKIDWYAINEGSKGEL
ncbi:MAG TPA: cell envelope integrity protein CreD [Tenuifilaceae bacterium]|nr:cell envelope integrity protein CreD [Tenuifilaceae bacterium]